MDVKRTSSETQGESEQQPITLVDGLLGAETCKQCCIRTFLNLSKSLYTTNRSDYILIELMNRSLFDLQQNYEVMNVKVARRLQKLKQNCLILSNACGMHGLMKRNNLFVSMPGSPIPLTYRGFDIDWQNFA